MYILVSSVGGYWSYGDFSGTDLQLLINDETCDGSVVPGSSIHATRGYLYWVRRRASYASPCVACVAVRRVRRQTC